MVSMSKQTVALVTGANKGLGLEIARQLGKQGITVVMGARSLEKAQNAAKELQAEGIDAHPVQLDVTRAEDIAALPKFFADKFGGLDILVNNAGVSFDFVGEKTGDMLRRTYETNVIGPFEITRALLPLLKASPAGRIVNQSSVLGSLTAISSGQGGAFAVPGYCSSKAALNMLTVIAALDLKDTKVKVNAAHPGWVQTDMGGKDATLHVTDGAKTAVALATLPEDGPTGGYFHLGKTLPW
jgi:NAD(P)-dependent dehydrogenase (short-subunit alcohol dehydrogenase family)